MRLDWDTIRYIMITLEDLPTHNQPLTPRHFSKVDAAVAAHHLQMLIERGFVRARAEIEQHADYPAYHGIHLSKHGFELMAHIRDERIWPAIRAKLIHYVTPLSPLVVKAVAATC